MDGFSFQLTAPLREPTNSAVLPNEMQSFQLTAPLREPTVRDHNRIRRAESFNSRLPCGSRRYFRCPIWIGGLFQLTAPLREPTPYTICPLIRRCFNSRLPCGSRLYETITGAATLRVSTHGSLAGADVSIPPFAHSGGSFNSRLPCGSRPELPVILAKMLPFQLTAPLREPT